MPEITAGAIAPNFELPDEQTTPWVLSGQLELGPVLLVFYRGDWCAYDNGQLAGLARGFHEIERRGVQIAGICVDPPQNNLRLSNELLLPFPLLSDPHGDVARLYETWNPEEGVSAPAIVAVGRGGVIGGVISGKDFADRPEDKEVLSLVRSLDGSVRGEYRGGERRVRVGAEDTGTSVRQERRVMTLEENITFFDGALLSAAVVLSRLESRRSSRGTRREVSRVEGTLRLYRDYLIETARLREGS
ncbi:peroxiredoxin family protein [Rubrobacter indicoceani]|uniref:peroxiredoxin family protein n=1 Tax=Rubrobacter indicoceani TaxID=2051957 RepID=UPI0013C471AE|nr:peroxiredoxin family protein [Rubrobacter indicoceani]